MMRRRRLAALLLMPGVAAAQPPDALEFGRYLSKYPGLYFQSTLSHNPRDRVFDDDGRRVDTVTPAYGPGNEFPESRVTAEFDWHLPLFESEKIPFVSSRLWNARAALGYARTKTEGPIGGAANEAGGPRAKSGVTDLEIAFGPVLYGSADWRSRSATPLSVLLLGEVRLPIGARDPDSPNNVGDSVYAFGARLGAHWQPQGVLGGFLLDTGLRYRAYASDQEPAFGAQAPAQAGRDLSFDATLARRLWRGLYAQTSYYFRDGADNEYRNVRFAANPPSADPLMDSFPDSGTQRDRGSREQRLQFGVGGFVTQRLWFGVQYAHPLSGRSGSFDLPYRQQMQGCVVLGNCNPTPNGSAHVDGIGSARAYASDQWLLSVRFSPGESRGARR